MPLPVRRYLRPLRSLRGWFAPLMLTAARARRRPARWLLPALGIALAAAFAAGVAAESQIASDESARSVLDRTSPLATEVRVTWQGAISPGVADQARALLRGLGLGSQTEVVLMNPVRLGGVVVRPAAIAPLGPWLPGTALGRLGPCRPERCPMLLAGSGPVPSTLAAIGVRIQVVGSAPLRSAVPLGFVPSEAGAAPVLVTTDVAGLESLPGLSGLYRTYSWLAPLPIARLHGWQLAGAEDRLARSQARLLLAGSQFSLSAPFTTLDEARAEASAAPQRLLLAGGGAIAALALFIVLAGGGLRRDQRAELVRLRNAGARTRHCVLFVIAESGWLCAGALSVGAAAGIGAAALLARAEGEPAGAILTHSLITPAGAIALGTGWLAATALLATLVLVRSARLIDLLAVAAAAALVATLVGGTGSDHGAGAAARTAVLCGRRGADVSRCGARAAGSGARGAGRPGARPPRARQPRPLSLAAGAGHRVPGRRRWSRRLRPRLPLDADPQRGRSGGGPRPARRPCLARAGFQHPARAGSASALASARGRPRTAHPPDRGELCQWRGDRDGSRARRSRRRADPDPRLAGERRLGATDRARPAHRADRPGPGAWADASGRRALAVAARFLAGSAVDVLADLRDPQGTIRQVAFGTADAGVGFLRAAVPRGRWELAALELDEPTGVAITNGHQNGENPAAATQSDTRVALGPLLALPARGGSLLRVPLGAWRGVGAAATTAPVRSGAVAMVGFAASGTPGVLRPAQPSDTHPVPVLADPQTAASAGPGGRIALTVDGLPVTARVVGVLSRFPTLPSDSAGFVIADEPTLAAALDAQLPGQGRADELWIGTGHLAGLRAALGSGALAQLDSSFRADIDHQLRDAPVAHGVLGTLIAATALSVLLAVVGLLAALLGGARDERVESDLEEQGVGPRGLRAELRVRLALASLLGVIVGLGVAVLLTRLAVASVRGAGAVADPSPPVVTVVPWAALAAWSVGTFAVLTLAGWLVPRGRVVR